MAFINRIGCVGGGNDPSIGTTDAQPCDILQNKKAIVEGKLIIGARNHSITKVGEKWSSLITNPFGTGSIFSIANINGVAVAVGSSGKIMRSADYGETWTLITNPFGTSTINAITNIDGIAIAFGSDSKMARSLDLGLTFGSLITNSFGGTAINCMADIDGIAVAGGSLGKLARSIDKGLTWTAVTSPFGSSSVNCIANINGTAIAVGTGGKIARSTDKGETWILITNPFGANDVRCIANIDGVAVAVGFSGRIVRSVDDGETWTLITNPFGTSALYSVVNVNGVAIVGGELGKLARSTDGGLTWSVLITNSSGGNTLYSIANVNGTVIIGINGGAIARSVDFDPSVGITNATTSDILKDKNAVVNGVITKGTIPSKTAQTYTPSTTNQTISAGQYLSGVQTIAGDANLIPANIVNTAKIFNVQGTAKTAPDINEYEAIFRVEENATVLSVSYSTHSDGLNIITDTLFIITTTDGYPCSIYTFYNNSDILYNYSTNYGYWVYTTLNKLGNSNTALNMDLNKGCLIFNPCKEPVCIEAGSGSVRIVRFIK